MSSLKINQQILWLALPNILANMAVPIISTMDTWLMGRLSTLHIGAIGLGSIIFDMVYWNFSFLRMGTTGITAQAYGSNDTSTMLHTLLRSLLLAFCIGVLLILLQPWLFELASAALDVSDTHAAMVMTYFGIRIFAGPATLSMYAFKGWFLGMQNAVFPMYLTIVTSLTNLIFSYYLVIELQLGVQGVAIGTVIAQYTGILVAILLFLVRYRNLLSKFEFSVLKEVRAFTQFLKINRDIFVRTICLVFAFVFFFRQSSRAGDEALAASVIMQQFLNWMSYGIDGFAYAAESLVGKYAGAQQWGALQTTIRQSFLFAGLVALGYFLVYWLGGQTIFEFFTKDIEVLTFVQPYLFWLALMPILGFSCYIWDGIFIGLLASKEMMWSMIFSLCCYLGLFYSLEISIFERIWIALGSFLVLRGVIQTVLFYKCIDSQPQSLT